MGHDETVSAAFDAELAACSALAHGLTDEQWRAPSLCDDWTVRDVVVHLAFHTHRAGFAETFRSIVTPEAKYMGQLVAREHGDTIEGLVGWLASPAPDAARSSITNLCELVIHQQDVRRPLGLRRDYPEATMRLCLEHCTTLGGATFVVGNFRRAGHRLRLVATDIDWSHGDGPEVTGPGEALLMAIARRPAALADLRGAGVSILAERLGVPVPAGAVPA